MVKYGVCSDCGKWGIAPNTFKENIHFLKCICGNLAYLTMSNPSEAGYRLIDKVELTVVRQEK